jgi:hypothetical protein
VATAVGAEGGDVAEAPEPTIPEDAIEGDVMVLMGGRLYVVDHLVPEAHTIDLTALQDDGARGNPTAD